MGKKAIKKSVKFRKNTTDFMYSERLGELRERTGKCVICTGDVVRLVTRKKNKKVAGGISTTFHKGFFCANCGLKYQFPPPKHVLVEAESVLLKARQQLPDLDDSCDPEGFVDHTPENLYNDPPIGDDEEDE